MAYKIVLPVTVQFLKLHSKYIIKCDRSNKTYCSSTYFLELAVDLQLSEILVSEVADLTGSPLNLSGKNIRCKCRHQSYIPVNTLSPSW